MTGRGAEMRVSQLLFKHVLLLSAAVLCLHANECKHTGTTHYFACSYYYQQFEDALIRDKNELFWLHRLFFPAHGHLPHTFWLTVDVYADSVDPHSCTHIDEQPAFIHDGAIWKGQWKFLLSSSALLSSIGPDVLFAFDNTITWAVHAMATGLGSREMNEYSLGLHLKKFPCMPARNILTEVIVVLLGRLKAFARVQGKPETWDGEDKVFVSLANSHDQDLTENVVYRNSHIEEELILAAFVLLTALIGLVLVWLATQYYKKIWEDPKVDSDKSAGKDVTSQDNSNSAEENSNDKKVNSGEENKIIQHSLYWSTAFVFCCFNICSIGVFIIAHLFKHPNLTTTDHAVWNAFITKMVIMPMLSILHLVVAILVVHRGRSHEHTIPKICCSRECVLHVLALYNILIFIQIIGAALIPLLILLLLYTFKVLSVLAFMSSGTFCFIVLIAHILLLNRSTAGEGRKGMSVLLLQACIIVVFLAVIGVLVAFYLFLLSHGVDTKGVEGFLLSLIPSLALTVAGGFIKKTVLKNDIRSRRQK